ncbi:unnamed protein product [[Candida] boidinii]|uniref:Unnamed protein product n=1 Tax=Candida boidinii TaxID=5477 RepID=A0A9W6WJ11_CANBO|nr:hypothetical protein B5S30_g4401 [[Candida] boidinii]OWB83848.1 hypothetical protein B5S33_g2483 [[Candida] boidinii]GME68070.1 unnamed protein product [[Candida] boidinii]GME76566.1 unnamed protein product [[Candida] boidinii]
MSLVRRSYTGFNKPKLYKSIFDFQSRYSSNLSTSRTVNPENVENNKDNKDKDNGSVNTSNKDADTGYMMRRLQQLAEDATPSSADPKAGIPQDALPYDSTIYNNVDKTELNELLDKVESSIFENKYQKEIGISKLPSYVNKHSRDLAMSKSWTGTESNFDASLRMLNDAHKPMKVKTTGSGAPMFRAKPTIKDRIHKAREGALDYKLSKHSDPSEKAKKTGDSEEDDGFAEMYKERLLGPAQLLNDSFASVDNSIKSLADQKIMDAQRRGEFKNLPRGKPLEGVYSTENAYIDRTEFHLNKIMKRQDAIPPWIEKQSSVEVEIKNFRDQLDSHWKKKAVHIICDKYHVNIKTNLTGLSTENIIRKITNDFSLDDKPLKSAEWELQESSYLDTKIRFLNDSLRGYNLQAPLASQKLYLQKQKEIQACYKRVSPLLPGLVKRYLSGEDDNTIGKDQKKFTHISNTGAPTFGELPQRSIHSIYQQPTESLGSMIWGIFKKDRS